MLEVIDIGLKPYDQGLELQRKWVEALRLEPVSEKLLLVEHPAVYTIGRKGQRLLEENPNSPQTVETVFVERGGETTYHNPGQLVAYPILKLQDAERSVPGYLRKLEQVIIDTLSTFGIAAESREKATGVWLVSQNKKIASIGVAIRRWITFHGIALNVHNDLAGFQAIQPCGFDSNVMTSMKQVLGEHTPTLERVKQEFVEKFCRAFHREPTYPSFPIASTGQAVMASSH